MILGQMTDRHLPYLKINSDKCKILAVLREYNSESIRK
jgi:hypothetical protein